MEVKETIKDKVDRLKWKAQMKADCAKENGKQLVKWVGQHPGEAIALIGTGVTVAGGINKVANKVSRKHDEKQRRKEFYDHKYGNWVTTKRELTGREKVEFAARRDEGESVTAILSSMNLLKK